MNANAQTLFERVREWAEEKGITGDHGRGTVMDQLGKVNEEIQELNSAIHDVDDDEVIDAIGDSIVTPSSSPTCSAIAPRIACKAPTR